MPELIVTRHALDRYRERIDDLPDREIEQRLTTAPYRIAAEFGARYVRLGSGHRVVIIDHKVITILPQDNAQGSMTPARDHLYEREGSDGAG